MPENDEERQAFEAYRRSTMSDWKEAQDAALTKELAPDGKTIRYRHELVEAQWQTWQASRASAALPQTAHVCKPPEERGYKYGNDWTCSCGQEFVLVFDKEDAARWEKSAVTQPSAGQTEGK